MNQATLVPRYWFPAKRYGWGWSLPVTWQGWAVLVGFIVALTVLAFVAPPPVRPVGFFGGTIVLATLVILACWLKGEPPRWRWGK